MKIIDRILDWAVYGVRGATLGAVFVAALYVVTGTTSVFGQPLPTADRELTADERCELGSLLYLVNSGRYEAEHDYNGDGAMTPADFGAWVAQLDADEPVDPPPPPTGQRPEWWPSDEHPSFVASDTIGVATAFNTLDGVGGFLTLQTQDAVAEFARRMIQGGGLEGTPETRVVIRTAPGVVIDRPMKNVRGEWKNLAFDRVRWAPERHLNQIALAMHGDHDSIDFLGCEFEGWKQVVEGQADGSGAEPDRIVFDGGSWERIYNSSSPVVTAQNQNDKNHRSQGAWWRGEGWVFRGLAMRGIGWDIAGDPDRMKPDKFSQALYASQNARNTLIENVEIDGAANNGIVYKGTGLTVRGSSFDRVVNAISLGTNENPRFACQAIVEDVEIRRLIPLNWKDDGALPLDEQVRADSGVGLSINNVDGVVIRRVRVTGENTGRRGTLLMFNNGKSSIVKAGDILVEDCDAGPLSLAEIRDFRVPSSGFTVRVRNTNAADMRIMVRNTVPSRASDVVSGFTVDGEPAIVR